MKIFTAILFVTLLTLQVSLWVGKGSLGEVWSLKQTVAEQQKINTKLKDRNAALNAEVLDLKNGLDAIEERARTELGMIKEGEIFYRVVENLN
ncbi:cell division protein FtsB [Gammaproteobacteria bacterium AH-315-C21]|nr:cell division protein FtsB [Gammaproteobacteria bacterium]MBN4078861.1 cell division protein FtsB [Gammaproteobacteria bacterium AH-315-C21]